VDLALSEQDLTIYGTDNDDKLAQDVYSLTVGDFNSDALADILVGTAAADGPVNSRNLAGESYVIFGQPALAGTIDLASSEEIATIYGAGDGDKLASVAAGDVNGDGSDEILVAAPYADGVNGTRQACGEAYVISLADSDGDGLLDIDDPCPSEADCDNDQFDDYVELYAGTDPLDDCPDNPTDDAWPPDVNVDTQANVLDVLAFMPRLLTHVGDGLYSPRFDLNADGWVNVLDVLKCMPVLLTSCTS
jgi:hypothetical protein